MRKRLCSILLSICMVLTMAPAAFAADGAEATVTDTEGAAVPAENGVWTLTDGSYTASGTADAAESIVIQGDVTLTMDNAVLNHTTTDKTKYAPAISIESGDANIILSGTNAVQGSAGYAGIYVAEGASLTISGEGSLNAKGGDGSDIIRKSSTSDFSDFGFDSSVTSVHLGGGAGIGGNGIWMSGSDKVITDTANIGTITVKSGEINVTGGKTNSANIGAGAGLGTGGTSTKSDAVVPANGNINIIDGTIYAIGGEGEENSETGGGAGIGSGGSNGGFYTQEDHIVTINISGGNITAQGGADSAGIGGGCNVDGGVIKIAGGIVTATGGHESSGAWGGAGIGGGDMGSVASIEISSGTVFAKAIGAAAGIGGGDDGMVGTIIGYEDDEDETPIVEYGSIIIRGDADVTAIGGSHAKGTNGGAGIGAGRSYYVESGFGSIEILDSAKVRAYAGAKAQAIGVGTYYAHEDKADDKVVFSKTANVWMFNQDTEYGAFWGQNADGTLTDDITTNDANLIWYTKGEEDFPAADMAADVSTKGSDLQWKYTDDHKVQILKDDVVTAEGTYEDGYTLGNWAAVLPKNENTITYKLNSADTDAYATYTIDADTAHKVISAPARDGYVFTGWSDGTNIYYAGQDITPDSDMTLTAQWQAVEDWSEKPSEDNGGKLDVDVDVNVNVDVAVDVGVSAEVSDTQKSDLSDRVRAVLTEVLNGKTPTGMTDEQASDLRTLLNKGASSINAQLTVYAELAEVPTEESLKSRLGDKFVSGETAQEWNLTVKLTTVATNGTTEIGKVEDVSITETSPITFTLTTGQDLSGKDVRVLYIHNGAVESAESSVTDAANGVVSVTASKFSPYIILSKTRASSGGSHSSSSGSTATYPVKVANKNPTGGAVSADKSSAAKGATVTVTVTPDKGYELDKLTVTDKDGKAVSLTAKGSGKYTFTMPVGQVTIAAAFAESDWTLSYRSCPKDKTCPIYPFTDAKTTDWYHDGVHFCLENKLMVGYGGNLFKPEDGTSRAMIAVMLWRLNGSPAAKTDVSFDDVGDGTWYTDAVRWATSEGIAQGYGNGKFGPNDTMTREQMVTILYRYAKASGYDVSVGEDTNILSYTDAASVAQYAIPAMQWACGSGMVQGSGNALLPQGSTTRAQMATMMMRFCAEIVK